MTLPVHRPPILRRLTPPAPPKLERRLMPPAPPEIRRRLKFPPVPLLRSVTDRLMEEWSKFIELIVREDVGDVAALGMDVDDVRQDIRVAMLRELRRQWEATGRLISPALVKTVIRRRAKVLNRNASARYRKADRLPVLPSGDDPVSRIPDEAGENYDDSDEAIRSIVEELKDEMGEDFRLLVMHHVEGLTVKAISQLLEDQTPCQVGRRIRAAREEALDHLREMGLASWEAV